MTVRLAFAVAAFLEPEILVIDEVLAVGDAEFQKKAIGKMQDISRGQGRTVLFVSHNMAAIRNLCTRAIVLENGTTVFEGNTNKAVDFYLKSNDHEKSAVYINETPKETADVLEVKVLNKNNEIASVHAFDDQIKLEIKFNVSNSYIKKAVLGFRIIDQRERVIFSSEKEIKDITNTDGEKSITVNLPKSTLVPNEYRAVIGYHVPNQEIIRLLEDAVTFKIVETGSNMHQYQGNDYGCVVLNCDWNI
jgi:lipopolysaccharide transport system ATP-binding protein